MPGPLPNPNARRRNTGSTFTTLPASGRAGAPPPYPLELREDDFLGERRRDLWRELWATPMAALWDRHRWTVPVARYVEMVLEYEGSPAKASGTLLSEMRQAEERLAMTTAGLMKARATIDLTVAGPATGVPATVVSLTDRARER